MITLCFALVAMVAVPVWVLCSIIGSWSEYTDRERTLIVWSLGMIAFVWWLSSR